MEQIYCVGFGLVARMTVNFPESQDTMFQDLREIGPTFLLLAPRLWEQIAADMRARIMDASSINQWIFDKGIRLGMSAIERRSEEHTSELQSLMRISYAVFCLKKKNTNEHQTLTNTTLIH